MAANETLLRTEVALVEAIHDLIVALWCGAVPVLHPTNADLAACLRTLIATGERRAILEHLMTCDDCAVRLTEHPTLQILLEDGWQDTVDDPPDLSRIYNKLVDRLDEWPTRARHVERKCSETDRPTQTTSDSRTTHANNRIRTDPAEGP